MFHAHTAHQGMIMPRHTMHHTGVGMAHHAVNGGAVAAHHAAVNGGAVATHHAVRHAVGGGVAVAHHGFFSMLGAHLVHSLVWQTVRRGCYHILNIIGLGGLARSNWFVGAIIAAIISTICYTVYRLIFKSKSRR